MRFFSEDLEFYHDKGGLADYAETAHGFHRLFDANKQSGMRRDLVPGSMEVYPVPGFGAIETNVRFFSCASRLRSGAAIIIAKRGSSNLMALASFGTAR